MTKVLVVDDSKTMNKLISGVFEKEPEHYELFKAFTIAQAREILQKEQIDFIMLDINLPDGSGYELVEEHAYSETTKIFVMTTEDDKQFVEMNYQKGVIEYIIKDKAFLHKIKKIPHMIEKIQRNHDKTVLIVDDSNFIRTQLKRLFSNRNYSVRDVATTLEAIEIIKNETIDLMLLDIELKNENGIDFLNKNRYFIIDERSIPVMIVSGYVDDVVTKLALKAGAVDVLKKPYVTEEMVLKVDFWIDYNTLNEHVDSLQKEFETVVKEKQLIETLLDAAMEMLFIHDKSLRIANLNKTAAQMLGHYKKEDLVGKPLQPYLFKESVKKLQEHIEMEDEGVFEGMLRIEGGKEVLIKCEPLLLGDKAFYITSLMDISEIKEKEAQLVQQGKMAQMGEMLSMIAHQWRQPLNIIATLNEMIRLKTRMNKLTDDELMQITKKITAQLHYLSRTIDDFREYFKPQKNAQKTTLDKVVSHALDLVEASLYKYNIKMSLDLASKKEILTYSNELQQVIINIIRNAEDALIENRDVENRLIKISTQDLKKHVLIEIEDNAGGIQTSIMEKIFEPYFSTKDDKKGTGLGLYMAKMIIEKHAHGQIRVENTDKGAKFIIKLPLEIAEH